MCFPMAHTRLTRPRTLNPETEIMRKERWVLTDATRARRLFSLILRSGQTRPLADDPRRWIVRGLRHLPIEAATEASDHLHADTIMWITEADEMAQSNQALASEAGRVFLSRCLVMGRATRADLFDQLTLSSRLDVAIAVLDDLDDEDDLHHKESA